MTKDLPPPELVEDERALGAMLAELEDQEEIAVDTEADSFFSYREKVCLIQVSAGGKDWIVDPLADLDVRAMGELFADPRRVKLFHDGEYDVLILKRDYRFDFAGLWDTRIAAAVLGEEAPGLATVLDAHFGVQLDKSLQRSDWSRRPLSDKQISYARLDTHFLIDLAAAQRPELAKLGRLEVVESECRRLEALEPQDRGFEPDEFVRIKGARTLSLGEMSALRELFVMRDELAKERNVPPFKVIANPTLLELARRDVRSRGQLADVPGFPQKHIRSMGEPVLEALKRAREVGPLSSIPKLPAKDGTGQLDEAQTELYERLKTWRKKRAEEEGFDASLVLNRHVMLAMALDPPLDTDAVARVDGIADWQCRHFAEDLVKVFRKFVRDRDEGRLPEPRRRRPRSR